jgi:hypothetical protein
MDFAQLFLQRHDVLYDFFLADYWKMVPEGKMRIRPHPMVNSIAWNLWHMTRVEDSGLNLFVSEGRQILDEGDWTIRLKIPWRHNGGGMTFDEVDDLNRRIDMQELHNYSNAVRVWTNEIVTNIHLLDLDETLKPERLKVIFVEEGLALSDADERIKWYSGWSKGKCLLNLGLTHPFLHVGEMGVITSLLGIVFE